MTGVFQPMLPGFATQATDGGLPVFVDTTVPVDLVIGAANVKRLLRARLDPAEVWSSTYSIMELRRTAVRALVYIRGLVLAAPDEEELIAWILRNVRLSNETRFRPRTRNLYYQAVEVFIRQVRGATRPRWLLVAELDVLINFAQDLDWLGIHHLVDESDCDFARPERPQYQQWPLVQHCNARQAMCRQTDYLDANRGTLDAVLTECETAPNFDATSLDTLRVVTSTSPVEARGQKKCWPLGDVILSLEARSVGTVLSSNRKDFDPICRVLGVHLETYQP